MIKQVLKEIDDYRQEIHNYIFSNELDIFMKTHSSPTYFNTYWQALKNGCKGGKCIRGYLIRLAYDMFNGKNKKEILKISSAYEILETAILAHDDIIDNSEIRRNAQAMHIALGGGEKGRNRALCVADSGLFISNMIVSNTNFDSNLIVKALNLLNTIYFKTTDGELLDIDLSYLNDYTEKQILEMYELKTANYTIIGPLLLGATLAGTSQNELNKIVDLGLDLGIMFQIQDDILGIFGKSETLGKSTKSDIIEGKKTILTSHFLANANKNDRATFNNIYGTQVGEQDEKIIRELLLKSGSKEYAQNKLKTYEHLCINKINKLDISPSYKEKLISFTNFLVERQK